jgi:hypothetical protein
VAVLIDPSTVQATSKSGPTIDAEASEVERSRPAAAEMLYCRLVVFEWLIRRQSLFFCLDRRFAELAVET